MSASPTTSPARPPHPVNPPNAPAPNISTALRLVIACLLMDILLSNSSLWKFWPLGQSALFLVDRASRLVGTVFLPFHSRVSDIDPPRQVSWLVPPARFSADLTPASTLRARLRAV